MPADQRQLNKTIDRVLHSETASDVFAKTYHSVRHFDPHDVPKMLKFVEQLVQSYSSIKEPHQVEIDGIEITFAS